MPWFLAACRWCACRVASSSEGGWAELEVEAASASARIRRSNSTSSVFAETSSATKPSLGWKMRMEMNGRWIFGKGKRR